ncbi:helix-turn-helix transcriptional regulator [Streptomyces sp. HNM0663]|uniref:Helix-turn-helix transcriptional regulator n=1 Tax=Streptomyces chengmaiensis TaxID=3040919 RepID=A0ABT6HVE7_9ACTN|nr:helix-turn-helix transcriptional regulator [Streptomyces chengmaiensis]MDH2392691.1 helix-turn-helix transcriptional regulator [Streptomyces chengmaiensis]
MHGKRNGNRPKRITSWHLIGAQLAVFRAAAKMTQGGLANLLGVSEETVASIEQGRRPLKMDLAVKLDHLLDTKQALQTAVEKVPTREKFPAIAQDLVDHEREALTLLSYQSQAVPGLLQTEEYARAVFASLYPPLEQDELEQWVVGRLDRQKVLTRKPPLMANFIMEESVLHRPIGGPEVLRRQIKHLRDCAEMPSLGLQVMPTQREEHAGLDGSMVLLETPDHDLLAYVEGQSVSFIHDDLDKVSVLHQKYGMLRSQALSPKESMRLLDELLGE